MKLEWFGHACFRICGNGGSIVFDPYADNAVYGLSLMRIFANAVICSHSHSDHNAADKVVISDGKMPFELHRVSCFHDEAGGLKRGDNTISVITVDGLRLAHMGDIGHVLDADKLNELGDIDIMLLPVGGVYTVDHRAAYELYKGVAPKIVVPMHYRSEMHGLRNVDPVDKFLRHFSEDDIHRVGSVWDSSSEPISSGVVLFDKPLQLKTQ